MWPLDTAPEQHNKTLKPAARPRRAIGRGYPMTYAGKPISTLTEAELDDAEAFCIEHAHIASEVYAANMRALAEIASARERQGATVN